MLAAYIVGIAVAKCVNFHRLWGLCTLQEADLHVEPYESIETHDNETSIRLDPQISRIQQSFACHGNQFTNEFGESLSSQRAVIVTWFLHDQQLMVKVPCPLLHPWPRARRIRVLRTPLYLRLRICGLRGQLSRLGH